MLSTVLEVKPGDVSVTAGGHLTAHPGSLKAGLLVCQMEKALRQLECEQSRLKRSLKMLDKLDGISRRMAEAAEPADAPAAIPAVAASLQDGGQAEIADAAENRSEPGATEGLEPEDEELAPPASSERAVGDSKRQVFEERVEELRAKLLHCPVKATTAESSLFSLLRTCLLVRH